MKQLPRLRRGALIVAAAVVVTACGSGRETGREGTLPDITAALTTSTTAAPTTTPAVTTAGPTIATTLPPTAPPTPAPTQPPVLVTSLITVPVPPTAAPTSPTAAPTTPPAAAPTAAPVLVTSLTTVPGPTTTSTVVVNPVTPPDCTALAIGNDTGISVGSDPTCQSGWAVVPAASCNGAAGCPTSHVFHITSSGWESDGTHDTESSCALTSLGMSRTTANAFGPCESEPEQVSIIRPGMSGAAVLGLQIALIFEGYPIVADASYGPRTEGAVRDFQARHGLDVDAIAGPVTQFTLGIGPDPNASEPSATSSATTTETANADTTTTSIAVPGSSSGSATTTVVVAGTPPECTAEVIGTDVGNSVTGTLSCGAGWAIERSTACGGNVCEGASVYHVTGSGWAYDGVFSSKCAEGLTSAGMTIATASSFAPICDPANSVVPTNIRPGSSDLRVRALQIALVGRGYPLRIDAVYGATTVAAVRDFQAANSLDVDGIAGPMTQAALGI